MKSPLSKGSVTSATAKPLVVIAVIALLVLGLSSEVYVATLPPAPTPTQPPNTHLPLASPSPTQTEQTGSPTTSPEVTESPAQTTPSTTQQTATPSSSVSITPTQRTTIPPTPTATPSGPAPRGLLDDLTNGQKTVRETYMHSANGNWSTYFELAPKSWIPGSAVRVAAELNFSEALFASFKETKTPNINNACLLITAERDFDPAGYQHTPWDEQVSTILTPAGLPIEGGGSATISQYTGYTQKTPVDVMVEVPIANFPLDTSEQWHLGKFLSNFSLPMSIPPGVYRLKLDFGFKSGNTRYSLNGDSLGTRPKDLNNVSCAFSPPIPSSGLNAAGLWVEGSQIARRSYWVLLWDYSSNGYRGVVANEDQSKVAISPRNLIHDEIILPKINSAGAAISYNLEPTFLLDNINAQRNIPWQYNQSSYTVKITLPNGTAVILGTSAFQARRGNGATTKNTTFTAWKPPVYGNYTVEAKGWIEDVWGNRYEGGGNYTFWIAERLTLATATFQGQAYNVGNRYGRDMAFNPPVPANVTIRASLYGNSDRNNVTTVVSTGQATAGGVFGAAQGMVALPLNTPGEYFASVRATYWDTRGTLWVCAMRHAGVVYPADSAIEAHGKKISLAGGVLADRGEKHWEGYTLPNGTSVLDHITFPYNAYDVLLIASEQQGSNKIEPVLMYTARGSNATYNSTMQGVGRSNTIITTSNGLSPEMFPEYIVNMQYFYGSAPRPGFNSRFIVSHDNIRAPYWPTSPNSFGGQIGASKNGDLPGDIYRLLGGVVVRNSGQTPQYAGYQASAFILPGGTNNNRVIGPGDEGLPSPDGQPARFFLTPVRPGMVYAVGATFGAVLQIDPVVPCNVTFTLTAPNGTTKVTIGRGDQYGYFVAADKWPLDQPGLWVYKVNATWNGYQGKVPGMPEAGGWVFVLENTAPTGPGLSLNLSATQTFSPTAGLNVTGNSTATAVYYAAIIPGAVLEEGSVTVTNGTFRYTFDPQRMADKIKTYDVVNLVNGNPEIGRVVHLTFFSKEQGAGGEYHSFVRVVLRGTTAVYVKER